MILLGLQILALKYTPSPIVPAPMIRIFCPIDTSRSRTACIPTAIGSIRAPSSKETSSPRCTTVFSGTTIYSPKDPLQYVAPKIFLFLQMLYLPIRHCGQSPQPYCGSAVTLSPTFTLVTSDPTSTTIPANSCPETSGGTLHACFP